MRLPVLVATLALCRTLPAQTAIAARAGLINHIEGSVTLDGAPLSADGVTFKRVRVGQTLTSADGRAELLLSPSCFLRLSEHSALRVLSDELARPRVQLLQGDAILECKKPHGNVVIVTGRADAEYSRRGAWVLSATSGCGAVITDSGFWRWAVHRSEAVAIQECLAAARRENPGCEFGRYRYQHSVYGSACLPGPDYCSRFRGPLSRTGDAPIKKGPGKKPGP